MKTDDNAYCPRCGGAFHCGAARALIDRVPCACSGITLSPDTTRLLRERYSACLCVRCLAELADVPQADTQQADEKKPAKP